MSQSAGATARAAAAEPIEAAATEAAASRAAARQDSRVEVSGLTTSTTKVFANPSGSFTMEQSTVPQRVRRDGEWVDLDTTLVRRNDGTVAPTAVPAEVRFSGGGDGPLVRLGGLGTTSDKAVELGWQGELPTPEISGSAATYAEVYPGVDLRVRATPRGITHELVVKTREAAADPRLDRIGFDVRGEGVTVDSDESGNVRAVDAEGRTVFASTTPMMWESAAASVAKRSTSPGTAKARQSTPKRSRVGVELGSDEVSLVPDQRMLSASDTNYPVVIDPDFSYVTPEKSAWTLVRRSHPNQANWNLAPRDDDERYAGVARVGHAPGWGSSYMDRSLFRFDTRAIKGARISKAQFQIHQAWKYSNTCDPAQVPPVELWLTGPIGPGTTWNNQPGWGRRIASKSTVPKAGQSCGPAWVGMNAHSAVQQAADERWNNVTLGLKATGADESSNNPAAWKRFHVKTQDGVRLYPKVFIEYNRPPDPPHDTWVEPWRDPCQLCEGTTYLGGDEARLKTRLTDPDGGQVRAIWDIQADGSKTREQWLASDSVFSTPLDLRGLHGKTVSWSVRGNDGALDGATANGPSFVVDRVAPGSAPGVSSSVYPADDNWHGGRDVPAEFTFDAAGVGDVDHYRYGFQDPPSKTVAADSLGGGATVTLTPPTDGPVDLYVQSVDRAGNRSPVTTHHFYVRAGNGPVAHWPLNGDVTDAAFLGDRDGSTHNGVSWTPGAVDSAVHLDGEVDYLTAPNSVPTDAGFSVSAWVRADKVGDMSRTAVSQDGEVVSGFMLQTRADGKWHFVLTGSDETDGGKYKAFATSEVDVKTGQWTHIAGVYEPAAEEIRLYVNGSLAATEPYWGDISTGGATAIGRAKWNGTLTDPWAGDIDEVRTYDRVLAESEIGSLVNLDNVRTGHWKFEQTGETGTVPNVVPGGQPATLHGDPGYTEGALGSALRLDGTDDHVTTDEPSVRSDGSYSVATWVRLDEKTADPVTVTSQNGQRHAAFELGYSGSGQDSWTWTLRGSEQAAEPEVATVSSARTPRTGVWTHLVGVHDVRAGQLRLFVNGELAGKAQFKGAWHPEAAQFEVGRVRDVGSWGGYLPGAVDELRTYSRALTPDEIRGIVSQDNVSSGSWKLDGDVTDDSGRGLDGTVHGDPTWQGGHTVHPNPGDKAIQLDGTDDYVETPNAVDTSQSFTVSTWAKLDHTGDWYEVLSQDGDRTSGFHLQVDPQGKWGFSMFGSDVDGGGTHKRLISAETAQLGVWTHLTAVYDSSTSEIRLYVNGALVGSAAHTSTWNATGVLGIGRGQWNGESVDFWPGAIDDVRTYSRVLYAEEIRLLAGRDLNLVHNLRLNESEGTNAADSVGNQPGTLHGDASFTSGRSGNAVSLDGTDDYVSTSGVDLRTDESFTVSAWVYLSNKDDEQVTAVSVDGQQTSKFRLGHVTDIEHPLGAWVFEMPESDTKSAPVTETAVATLDAEINSWTHLTGVYDATTGKLWLYVNGSRINDGTLHNTWQSDGGLQIGRGKDAGAQTEFWPGSVDDVRLYTGRLSTDRIESLYASYGNS
ncbi:LamG-like jellyroll fold domain-containing protein [Actinopolyspora erythraea]|uniref:LamG-like jellyroll fold domain-containing protein n=1 Tax=Actinopolyspora erythraea TaxID=414996 RepID=UPI001186595B|nr:LamG-like jellyroll fold domain-containing protein [Actinopolyspora erythraea]